MLARLLRLFLVNLLILAGGLGELWLTIGPVMTEGLVESLEMRPVSAAWRRSFDNWDMVVVLFDSSFVRLSVVFVISGKTCMVFDKWKDSEQATIYASE